MDNLKIERTKSTPYIFFDAASGRLRVEGESYPENVVKFYTPVLDWLHGYFAEGADNITLEFKVAYFNSSTSKVFMTIFDLLEEYVTTGRMIEVVWICDRDNDVSIECGEEFKEEVEQLSFRIEAC
jgi:hypothetical protein